MNPDFRQSNADECRRRANAARCAKWAVWFSAFESIPVDVAVLLWREARGHVPTLDAIVEMWSVRKFSDRAVREAGFRPNHPVEGEALEIIRRYP